MLSDVLIDLVETSSDTDAWEQLFRYFNQNTGKGDVGYQLGEKMVIKLNLNKSQKRDYTGNGTITTPQLVLSLLRQLVNNAGVDDCDKVYG